MEVPNAAPHRPRHRRWHRGGRAAAGRHAPVRAGARRPRTVSSRPLIREALRSVEELGLIETRPGTRHLRPLRGTLRASTAGSGSPSVAGAPPRASCPRRASRSRCEAASLAAARADAEDHRRAWRPPSSGSRRATASSTSRTTSSSTSAIAAAAHNPVIEMMLEAIAPQTVALMVRSVGDPQVMVRSQPYHRRGPRGDPSAATAPPRARRSART